jgi:hypothetical protein
LFASTDLGYQQIARNCAISLCSLRKYLALGIAWPLPNGWTNEQLNAALFPAKAIIETSQQPPGKQVFAGLQLHSLATAQQRDRHVAAAMGRGW